MIHWDKARGAAFDGAGRVIDRAKRDDALAPYFNDPRSEQNILMDFVAADIACRIDFDRLIAARRGDFVHDFAGIYQHLDRRTGELGGCFVPRSAAQ